MAIALSHELEVASAAVRSAAAVCVAVQQHLVSADTLNKKDRSPVTVADFASQAVVCAALADAFPHDPVVAEENADELRRDDHAVIRAAVVDHVRSAGNASLSESDVLAAIDRGASSGGAPGSSTGRFWTLDPIDGTKGFLRGQQYAVALGLIENGKVILGILGCPNLPLPGADVPGVLMTAVRGEGTRMTSLSNTGDAQAVSVSSVAKSTGAKFCESVESGHSDQDASVRIARLLGITAQPYRIDSQCKYAAVARGDAEIYMRLPTSADYRENIWDHAAGMLCVEAAGGIVSDIHGRPLDFSQGRRLESNQGILATNAQFHDQVVSAVQQVLG